MMKGLVGSVSEALAGVVTLLVVVGTLALSATGWSQGFMVKPMKIVLSVRPGMETTQVIEMHSTLPEKDQVVELSRLDVRQGENGTLTAIETPDPNASLDRSCLQWMSLDSDTISVKALATGTVTLKVKVPPAAHGVYVAGIAAQTKPDPGATGVRLAVRFLIPVIVEVQGPPVRQKVDIADTGLVYARPAARDAKSTTRTLVTLNVANTGESYPQVKPTVRMSRLDGTRWRVLPTLDFDERGVLPGQSVRFAVPPKQGFPAGKYRLVASMTLDGRPVSPLTKEVDYAGDPNAGLLASEVELVMEPQRVECDVVAGGRRTATITLRNPTDEAVNVALGVAPVEALKGVMLGEIKGEDFSADKWATVNPAEFQLPKNGQRKVAVQFAFPREGLDKAAYYATLNLTATHPDGQPAGKMQALVLAANKKGTAEARMYGQGLSLTQAEKNQYTVIATFGNVGGVYLDPSCKGVLVAASGLSAVKTFDLTREPAGLVLPLGTPRWNGTVDFSGVAEGGYTVKVVCEYGGKSAPESFPVKVTDGEGGQKVVEVIGEVTKE